MLLAHVYTQKLNEEQWERIKLQNLDEIQTARERVLFADGVRTVRYEKKLRVVGPCWIYPDHKAPRQDEQLHPVTLPAKASHFYCEGRDGIGKHDITIEQYLLHAHPDTKERRKHLKEKIGIGHPELFRFSVFELDGQIGVALNPNDALAQMRLGDAETLRGVVIWGASLAAARQIAGQLHDKLPWCEQVKLNRDGTLSEIDWHGGQLTQHENGLLEQQRFRARIHENALREAEAEVLRLRRKTGAGV